MTLSAPSAARAARTKLVRLLRSNLFTLSTGYISTSAALATLFVLVFITGCGGGSGGGSSIPPNPAPSDISLTPNSGTAGDPAFTLTVSGSNFISSSTVEWNGNSRHLTTNALVDAVTIPNVSGNPLRVIRWDQNGLALITDDGKLYVVGGNFVH
jgi:hypothetical protein